MKFSSALLPFYLLLVAFAPVSAEQSAALRGSNVAGQVPPEEEGAGEPLPEGATALTAGESSEQADVKEDEISATEAAEDDEEADSEDASMDEEQELDDNVQDPLEAGDDSEDVQGLEAEEGDVDADASLLELGSKSGKQMPSEEAEADMPEENEAEDDKVDALAMSYDLSKTKEIKDETEEDDLSGEDVIDLTKDSEQAASEDADEDADEEDDEEVLGTGEDEPKGAWTHDEESPEGADTAELYEEVNGDAEMDEEADEDADAEETEDLEETEEEALAFLQTGKKDQEEPLAAEDQAEADEDLDAPATVAEEPAQAAQPAQLVAKASEASKEATEEEAAAEDKAEAEDADEDTDTDAEQDVEEDEENAREMTKEDSAVMERVKEAEQEEAAVEAEAKEDKKLDAEDAEADKEEGTPEEEAADIAAAAEQK